MTIDRSGATALASEIIIKPELPIGTELWFMKNNKPWMALVAAYDVRVTSYNVKADYGWYEQLFGRWHNKRQKEYWNYSWEYNIKIDGDIMLTRLIKKGDHYFIGDARCYLSKQELLKSL